MQICMLWLCGQAVKLQITVATLQQAEFLSPVQKTHLYGATLSKEVIFPLWVTFTHLGRTTRRISLSLPVMEFTELSVQVAAITLAQRKMSYLLKPRVLLHLPLQMQASWGVHTVLCFSYSLLWSFFFWDFSRSYECWMLDKDKVTFQSTGWNCCTINYLLRFVEHWWLERDVWVAFMNFGHWFSAWLTLYSLQSWRISKVIENFAFVSWLRKYSCLQSLH